MGKGYLIDSNVVIGYLDKRLPEQGMLFLHTVVDDTPIISVINKIEVLRFNTSPEKYKVLTDFVEESIVIGLDESIVDRTIEICKAHRIKLPDAIIAASALNNDLVLITRNISDFKSIDGLELVDPWDAATAVAD